jgi:hypothetical protein
LADTRASFRREDGTWKTVSDTTTKLFAIPVRCYTLDDLTLGVGAWLNPYFETKIGLGFSGSCFEALTVISHITQSLSALVDPNGIGTKPTGKGIVNLVAKLTEQYFDRHEGHGDPSIWMLVFGFDDEKPWTGRVTWKTKMEYSYDWATEKTLETVGHSARFRQYATELVNRIKKHKNGLRTLQRHRIFSPSPESSSILFRKPMVPSCSVVMVRGAGSIRGTFEKMILIATAKFGRIAPSVSPGNGTWSLITDIS